MEESTNLASGFHLAGFRHVIAGLWSLADRIAASTAKGFYAALTFPTAADTAAALNRIAGELRDEAPDHPELWAPLIHSGP